jgi:hypothetical protein
LLAVKVTLPSGVPPVAVKITCCPKMDGFKLGTRRFHYRRSLGRSRKNSRLL